MTPDTARTGRPGLVIAVAAAAIAAAACGGSQPASPGAAAAAGQRVTITGNSQLRFAPMTVRLHPGTVRITLRDMGAYPHNIVIPALHVTSPTVTGDPGGTRSAFTVRFPRPGRFAFHCQYHQGAGMVGVFVVTRPA